MMNYRNILVPTDFSENSVKALEFACGIVKQNKSNLHLLHIIEPRNYSDEYENRFYDKTLEQSILLEAEEEMRRFIGKISSNGIKIIETINSGKPHEQIIRYSHKENIDLIVIASHGWTGLTHLITGNIANKVMRYSDVPTICIKSNNLVMQKDASAFKTTFAENWVG